MIYLPRTVKNSLKHITDTLWPCTNRHQVTQTNRTMMLAHATNLPIPTFYLDNSMVQTEVDIYVNPYPAAPAPGWAHKIG